jgi:hypothetical protein
MFNFPAVVEWSLYTRYFKQRLPKNKWYISEFDYLLQSDGDCWSKTDVTSSQDMQF